MNGYELIDRMAELADRYRFQMLEQGVVLTPPAAAPAFMGIPVSTSPFMPRMSAVLLDGRLVLHEHTLEVLRIALLDHRSPDDPEVHLEASLALILRQIDARASRAVQNLDDMARAFAIRARHYEAVRWCDQERDRHAYMQWTSDHYQLNLWECFDCGMEATAETLAHAGVLNRRPLADLQREARL